MLPALRADLVPPPWSPARGLPTDWGELVKTHGARDVFQASPASSRAKAASSITGTPSLVALSSLLPASAPATR